VDDLLQARIVGRHPLPVMTTGQESIYRLRDRLAFLCFHDGEIPAVGAGLLFGPPFKVLDASV
jgi:hypothetical protein